MPRTKRETGDLAEEALKEVRSRIRAARDSLNEGCNRLHSGFRADAFDFWLRAYENVVVGFVLLDLLTAVRAISPKEHRELRLALWDLHRDVWDFGGAIGLPA